MKCPQCHLENTADSEFCRKCGTRFDASTPGHPADHAPGKPPEKDALRKQLEAFSTQADGIRKKIVATKEGGAITGEERLREHMDSLYGAILSYEGRPAQYQMESIDALQRELDDVIKEFDAFTAKALPKINGGLKAKGMPLIVVPPVGSGSSERR